MFKASKIIINIKKITYVLPSTKNLQNITKIKKCDDKTQNLIPTQENHKIWKGFTDEEVENHLKKFREPKKEEDRNYGRCAK